uniref:Uncharacterized protein n=1 Tax=Candidatus Kentrum sp. TC TaxID=2126339 RepID=A0A450YJV9_9GAMM|nr:MAG: hypothetical protein BECKTC1821D_GA0114238_100661 [Candidatus Kentron sp. TC]VFK41808.1 MAG: hypothetical protein BECKTC1821E_GA0114239_101446 [Candidatus Kentron sp. TC]VFK65251.1 MAG: hypothetical protein BECKTC1821F_GA0114240_11743 [Candidatus Kentron sp. TC]
MYIHEQRVHVRDYWRFRLGSWEHVRKHTRSYPGSKSNVYWRFAVNRLIYQD